MDSTIRSKVWVSNFSGHDYTKLSRFGEIRFITRGFVAFDTLDRVKYTVAEGMIEVEENDYLALSGASIIGVIAAILWYIRFKKVQVLNYDKLTQDYRDITLDGDSIELLTKTLQV